MMKNLILSISIAAASIFSGPAQAITRASIELDMSRLTIKSLDGSTVPSFEQAVAEVTAYIGPFGPNYYSGGPLPANLNVIENDFAFIGTSDVDRVAADISLNRVGGGMNAIQWINLAPAEGLFRLTVPYTVHLQGTKPDSFVSMGIRIYSQWFEPQQLYLQREGLADDTLSGWVSYDFSNATQIQLKTYILATDPIPEPETYAMLGMGLIGLAAARRLKTRSSRLEKAAS